MIAAVSTLSIAAQAVIQVVLLSSVGAALEAAGELGPARRAGLSALAFRVLLPGPAAV